MLNREAAELRFKIWSRLSEKQEGIDFGIDGQRRNPPALYMSMYHSSQDSCKEDYGTMIWHAIDIVKWLAQTTSTIAPGGNIH